MLHEILARFFAQLYTLPLLDVSVIALVGNIGIFIVSLLLGHGLIHIFRQHAITEPPPPLSRIEIILAILCVILNAVVAVVGIILWRAGFITIVMDTGWNVILDTLVLFFAMDLGMYIFHRIAHHRLIFPIVHVTHHRFENPRPLTLFVLNPIEVLGFGTLWLLVLVIYSANWMSVFIYLTLNVLFGLVGHLNVEPLPRRWLELPVLNYISTSTFHAEHHMDKEHNFGFYTLIWDRLFGTISPDYTRDFTAAADPAAESI